MKIALYFTTCGLINRSSAPDIQVTDRYGNTYSFGKGTSEDQIADVLSVPTGEISAACSDVQTAFAKTDNLEIRIAPTKSATNTADNWRIIRACPDTGSGVCLVALNVAKQAGMLLNPVDNSKVYTANNNVMTIAGTAEEKTAAVASMAVTIW